MFTKGHCYGSYFCLVLFETSTGVRSVRSSVTHPPSSFPGGGSFFDYCSQYATGILRGNDSSLCNSDRIRCFFNYSVDLIARQSLALCPGLLQVWQIIFLLSKLRSEFCLCQQLIARWPDLSHHWQTTEFLFDEKLTLLLFRHIVALFPGFEHNWQEITLDCAVRFTSRPERGSRNRHLSAFFTNLTD